ncbi:MAG: hypothetical protein JW742_00390 [Candidatus Aminicenantes bacterium]|nr:hypothetical protein [Candidatus Aminicenantes bacterium]
MNASRTIKPPVARGRSAASFGLLFGLILSSAASAAGGQERLTADAILAKSIEAAGGMPKLAAVKALSFRAGPETYLASSDGRLKVRAGIDPPVVYEAVLVAGGTVLRNTLNLTAEVEGAEAVRWNALALFLGGVFTPRLFPGPFELAGVRNYGPARHYILKTRLGGAEVAFSIDAADFLVKRMVLRVPVAGGDPFALSCEFADHEDLAGLKIPATVFFSRVGVGGTGTPGPRPVADFALDPPLPPDAFDAVAINAGASEAAPGALKGQILAGFGYDDERIAVVFTNWSREDIARAGFKAGDRLAVHLDGFDYEATFYPTEEDKGEDYSGGAYDPGKAMLTLWPSRVPMYHLYFSILPQALYDRVRAKSVAFRPVEVRLKSR